MNFKEFNQNQIKSESNQKNQFYIRFKLFIRSIKRTQKKFIILNFILLIILMVLISLMFYSKQTKLKPIRTNTHSNGLFPITRTLLEKLDQLQNSLNQEDGLNHLNLNQSNQKMPMVTSLPSKPSSTTNSNQIHHQIIPAEEIDRMICPNQTSLGLSCSFLLPGFIGEQETKAQIHLHQLGLLSIQLNRTLVLPNVSKSRMGTCLNYPFDLYYQIESLNRLGIHSISYTDFINWTFNRFPNPTAQLVSILDSKSNHLDHTLVKIELDSIETIFPTKPERNVCLNKGKSGLNFTFNFPITITSPERWNKVSNFKEEFGQTILKTLGIKDNRIQPNVLVMNYDLRHPIYSIDQINSKRSSESILPDFQHFQYAKIWNEIANLMIQKLPAYISIHWRQETIPIETLKKCSNSLIPRLLNIQNSFPSLTSIYLSTDYPIEEVLNPKQTVIAHSSTYSKLITQDHHILMKKLILEIHQIQSKFQFFSFDQLIRKIELNQEMINKLKKLPNVMELIKLQKSIPNFKKVINQNEIIMEILIQLDSGLIGIIEKLIGIQSNLFLTGLPNQCSKTSSFTKQIIQNRLKLIELIDDGIMDTDYSHSEKVESSQMKSKVLNVVEFWDSN